MSAQEWLDRTQAITDAATPGPWEGRRDDLTDWMSVVHDQEFVTFVAETGEGTEKWAVADAEFIAHARTALPQAVAALRSVMGLHRVTDDFYEPYQFCVACSSRDRTVAWPCPTVTAITNEIGEQP